MTTGKTTARDSERAVTQREANALDIKRAKATDKPLRYRCGKGLFCVVTPAGTKTWKTDYWRAGKHYEFVLGHYPAMSLADAHAERMKVRQTVRAGGNPRVEVKQARAERTTADATTVRSIAAIWMGRRAETMRWTPAHRHAVDLALANHVFPRIGDRPIARVTATEVEELIWTLAGRFRSQAVHVRQHLTGLFDYAVRHDLIAINPLRKIAEDLPRRKRGDPREQTHAHVKTIEDARRVIHGVETVSNADPFNKLAHRLIALTAVRKQEGTEARWSEVDLDAGVWIIAAERMKGRFNARRPHVVALSPQAVEIFQAAELLAKQLDLPASDFVFPARFSGVRRRPAVGNGTLNEVLNRVHDKLGVRHVVHGWRSTFFTLLMERDHRDERVIDMMLSHQPIGPSYAARHYDHAKLVAERRRIACVWADMLLDGAPSAFALIGHEPVPASNVVNLRRVA